MIGQDRGHFFLIFVITPGKITWKWLAENRLATAAKVKKFLFVLASRFGIVDEESIDELKELSENENTKKSTEQW